MERDDRRLEATYYGVYAEELREKFRNGFLAELVPYPQFVVWKHQQIDEKPHKPPYSPRYHKLADTSNQSSWGTLDQSLKALTTGNFNGIGFVFSQDDPYSMIDLDHCVGNNRSIDKWAQNIIDALHTYTEYSPRDGVHMITEAYIPGKGRKIGAVEMYSSNHFMTLTLNHVQGTPKTIEKRQSEHTELYLALVPEPLRSQSENTRGVAVPTWMTEPTPDAQADQRVLEKAMHAANGQRFKRYWEGDTSLWEGKNAAQAQTNKQECQSPTLK